MKSNQINKREEVFHKIDLSELFKMLGSNQKGLSELEASKRLADVGPNVIKEAKKTPLIFKFLANFYHTFAILLWVSAFISFGIHIPELGWAIIAVIFINAIFSFWQEFQAEKAIEALKKLIPSYAKVVREGETKKILSSEVVPGDVIALEEGDNIAADARILNEFEMRTNNSTLTGESEPVRKMADPIVGNSTSLIEAPNVVFAGTSVAYGSGRALVFSTGMETQFGKIAALTQKVKTELSPLQKEVNKVAIIVALIAVGVGVVMFGAGSQLAKLSLITSFTFAIGMIVANVPEGLLPTLSLALATGVREMARRNALVKKLSSVETLGSTTVICTDKTGTLTQNEMTVREIWFDGRSIEVTGVGYNPEGSFRGAEGELSGKEIGEMKPVFKAAAFCNNARLLAPNEESPNWSILGDPTEAAMLVASQKGGCYRDKEEEQSPRIYEIPFDSKRKRMSTIHLIDGKRVAFVKGAPNEILRLSSKYFSVNGETDLTDELSVQINMANDRFARAALRVLAVAYREIGREVSDFTPESVENDLVFVGLMAMQDPPRPEVEKAVDQCYTAGIKIIMITGDYGLTAESIAMKIGIVRGEVKIISGGELDGINDDRLKEILKDTEPIFARVSPEHKMRVVAALKDMGHIVSVTGDGVNDAPALKKADIGVAMGITGTDVAKEAASMILTDDNFASIVNAVKEGRVIYDNIKKFVAYIFAHLGPEAAPFILFVLGTKAAIPLGLTAMQILAIDLGTETLPALALGLEKAEPGVMKRPPRSRKEGLLNLALLLRAYLFFGVLEAIMVTIGFFWVLYGGGWHPGLDIMSSSSPLYGLYLKSTTMVFVGIVMTQIGTVFACRTNVASIFQVGFFKNKWILWGILFELIVTLAIINVPFLQSFFQTTSLGLREWMFMLWYAPVILMADELRKYYIRSKSKTTRMV